VAEGSGRCQKDAEGSDHPGSHFERFAEQDSAAVLDGADRLLRRTAVGVDAQGDAVGLMASLCYTVARFASVSSVCPVPDRPVRAGAGDGTDVRTPHISVRAGRSRASRRTRAGGPLGGVNDYRRPEAALYHLYVRVWPLTGRAAELRYIDESIRQSDGPRGVVLAGSAGVGKTRVAREALALAEQRGMASRWARATASAHGLPLGPFAGLLGEIGGDPLQVLRQASDALLAGAGSAGVLVCVDDAHLLDELSASLVQQLVQRQAATVLVTIRTGEPAPDAVTALWKDGLLDRLELQPLSELEAVSLLEKVLGGQVDSSAAARLWALTQGNALFLRQLVDGELQAGRLRQTGGVWRWLGEPVITPGLVELVAAQMGQLPESLAEVVDLLALGEPMGAGALATLTRADAVEQAEMLGLITIELDGRRLQARLAHPLYGEVRRARIGQLRTRRLRGLVASALATAGGQRADDTLRRALLALDSDLDPDPALFTLAARHAAQLMDLAQAERLARAAVVAGGGFRPQATLAYAASFLGRGDEAEAELGQLSAVAMTPLERATVSWIRAGNLFWPMRRPDEAERVLADAYASADEDGRQMFTAMQAAFHVGRGRPSEGLRCGIEALGWSALPQHAVPLASFGVVGGLGLLGRAGELSPAADRGYAAARGSFDVAFLRYGLASLHIMGLRLGGYSHEAIRVAAALHDESSGLLGIAQLYGVALVGHAELVAGKLQSSVRSLREARAGLSSFDTSGHNWVCVLNLTQALAMLGDAAGARQSLAEAEAERHPSFAFLDTELALARAWVAAAEGATSEANAVALEAAALAADRGLIAHELFALHTAVCFGDRSVAQRLGLLAAQVDGPRAPAASAHAAALAADDGQGLLLASAQLERCGDLIAAADAAAQAATACRQRGQDASARAATATAQRLAQACEGARTPAVASLTDQAGRLTPRESEIARLAAAGLTNRAVAARLVISVRTVDNTLAKVYTKLGINSREALALLLDE
jgi:DNA-binding NarL/FixJ family response regulator